MKKIYLILIIVLMTGTGCVNLDALGMQEKLKESKVITEKEVTKGLVVIPLKEEEKPSKLFKIKEDGIVLKVENVNHFPLFIEINNSILDFSGYLARVEIEAIDADLDSTKKFVKLDPRSTAVIKLSPKKALFPVYDNDKNLLGYRRSPELKDAKDCKILFEIYKNKLFAPSYHMTKLKFN